MSTRHRPIRKFDKTSSCIFSTDNLKSYLFTAFLHAKGEIISDNTLSITDLLAHRVSI